MNPNEGQLAPSRFRAAAPWALGLVLALSGLYGLLTWHLDAQAGLTQSLFQGVGATRTLLKTRLTRTVDLSILDEDARLPRRVITIRWTGAWYVRRTGLYDLALSVHGVVTWRIVGELAEETTVADDATHVRTVSLASGFHDLAVEFADDPEDEAPALRLSWAPVGAALQPLDPESLFPSAPEHPRWTALLETLRMILRFAGAAGLGVAAVLGLRSLSASVSGLLARSIRPSVAQTIARVVGAALVVIVVGYAAALRFDALTRRYGPVTYPTWLHALQERTRAPLGALRPGTLGWEPVPLYPHRNGLSTRYISDPYTYLEFARAMRSFYAAHYREPVFPFVTKVCLRLLHDQDVAVSVASASFSVLAVIATYLLGSLAFSRWVGLGAAFAMAIESDVISWGVSGWRDDAFTFSVVMFAYALLRYVRVPSNGNAALMGVCGGLACLVRITSFSFLLPGFACLLVATRPPRRARLGGVGLAVLITATIVAPYVFNCWRVFGDPLYAMDYHTGTYLASEGQVVQSRPTAAAYVTTKALSRPFGTVDTVALGLTSYPFLNKWQGFEPWISTLGTWLSRAALFGLVLFVGSAAGRLLLVVLAGSLIPYAVTWRVISDWRFTEHAYPFFLIAAAVAISQILSWLAPSRHRVGRTEPEGAGLRIVLFWTVVLASIAGAAWTIRRVLPVLTVREAVAAREATSITAGDRDASFFGEGWSAPFAAGNVTARVSQGPYSIIWIPLRRAEDCDLSVRVDPFPRPLRDRIVRLPTLRVFVNGTFVRTLELGWNSERVGAYDIRLPQSALRAGFNRLAFMVDSSSPSYQLGGRPPVAGIGEGGTFRLWYVRIRPPAMRTPSG
jgi:hypothetical protein